jgi:hypothetical protein
MDDRSVVRCAHRRGRLRVAPAERGLRTSEPPRVGQPSPEATPTNAKPTRTIALAVVATVVAMIVLYPLSVGPLAVLDGAGVLDQNAINSIRPIYAPLKPLVTTTRVGGLLVAYEMQCRALGRRLHN